MKILTGQYLSEKADRYSSGSRKPNKKYIEIIGARENNLKNIDVKIPIGLMTCNRGFRFRKELLVNEILYKALPG